MDFILRKEIASNELSVGLFLGVHLCLVSFVLAVSNRLVTIAFHVVSARNLALRMEVAGQLDHIVSVTGFHFVIFSSLSVFCWRWMLL